jgi:hypothetical protein
MMPGTTTPTDRDEERAEARRKVAAAVDLVSGYAMLTARQRGAILEALNAADWQIALQYAEVKRLEREVARLARVTPDNPHGYRREFPTAADRTGPTLDEWREEWAHTLGNADNIAEAIGIALGAASMCWENPAGAGTFESDRASVLVDVLTEYVLDQVALRHKACDQRIDLLTEQLNQRDAEITKRWKRNRELNGDVAVAQDARAKAEHERDRLRARNEEIEADRVEQLRTLESMRAERDKAAHNMRRERARADRYCRDAEAAEGRLEQIAGILNRTPFPPDRTDPEPGDSWVDHVHERADLARQLRAEPGAQILECSNPWGPGGIVHQLRRADEPGPRPGPTPATPSAIGHSPSLHMLGACPCQAGTPFDPDYTEADLDPATATAADEETPV